MRGAVEGETEAAANGAEGFKAGGAVARDGGAGAENDRPGNPRTHNRSLSRPWWPPRSAYWKSVLDAEHEGAGLVVETDWPTADEAAVVITPRSAKRSTPSVPPTRGLNCAGEDAVVAVSIGEAVAGVHTDVEAGPGEDRNRGEDRRRLAAGKIGGHDDGRETEQRHRGEQKSFHVHGSIVSVVRPL
jgi:hypothetical protein